MKLNVQNLGLSLLAIVSAAPVDENSLTERTATPPSVPCFVPQVSQLQAQTLVERYSAVIAQKNSDLGSPTQTANLIVDSTYSEQSDSANIQIGIPLGQLTTPSKQAFITNSQKDPPVVAQTLGGFVAGCNNVLWQWRSTSFGSGVYQIQGFHLFELDQLGLIHKTYFEFDSIAGALDIGFTVINQEGQKLTPANV